jgi:hypothetical protein
MLLWSDERAAELAAAERNKRRKGKNSIEDSLLV